MTNYITISNFFFKNSKKKIFFICNILGLALAFLIIFIFEGKFKSKVIINYPTEHEFLILNQIKKFVYTDQASLHIQYKIIFNKNFLSDKNLQEFINNNKKDNLLLQKFGNNIKLIKKLPFNLDNGEFFLVFDKGVDGKELLINYVDYIKKESKKDFFNKYKELILSNIESREKSLKANEGMSGNPSDDLLIKSLKFSIEVILSRDFDELNKLYLNFDFEKFDYNPYEDLPSDPLHLYYSNYSIIFFGLIFGSLLFFVIIFLNLSVVNKKNNFSSKNYL